MASCPNTCAIFVTPTCGFFNNGRYRDLAVVTGVYGALLNPPEYRDLYPPSVGLELPALERSHQSMS